VEIGEVLRSLNVQLRTPDEFPIIGHPAEDESSYQGNAIAKARFYYDQTGLPTLADDSGIHVEALSGELGIHTRRWGAGPEASDQEWIEHFLECMEDETNRRASFVCVLAYIDQSGQLKTFEGRSDGTITHALESEYLPGLPISACFRPDGYEKVFSALTVEEKNSISHRGRALLQMKKHLESVQ
jgi:XTP/dITP diphosphohydrolase